MIALFKLALRNLVKNVRRSMITALAIALGFAAVTLFRGFAEYVYKANRQLVIFANAQGHLTVFKKGFLDEGRLDPSRFLLGPNETRVIEEICKEEELIEFITPQLTITGLLTDGKVSTIFIARGIVPSARDEFLKRITFVSQEEVLAVTEGQSLRDDQLFGVGVARGLARLLDLTVGSDAVAFSNTVDGQINALDVEVFQLFNTSSDQMNDKFMIVPLCFARSLFDTDGADRMAILLARKASTERVRERLVRACADRGLSVEIKTWEELSDWYRNVKDLLGTIFTFLFVIVFIIVVMSVVNTMGMAVLERTREIGTLRALGLKRRGVVALFAVESSLLSAIGCVAGLGLTFVGWGAVRLLKPTWRPPGITDRVVWYIDWVPETMVSCFFFLLLLCMMASLVPASRAARSNIVDALGHV